MVYTKDQIMKLSLEIIKESEPLFIQDLIALLPCGRSTFYELFPEKSEGMDIIKGEIAKNKIKRKSDLRKNWKDPEAAPALQLALYKLMADPEEHKALLMQYQDHTTAGEKINIISLGSGKNPNETS